MRKYLIPLLALAMVGMVGCTDASINAMDESGSKVGGPMLNGQISYSSGAACAQVAPNPGTPIPTSSTTTTPSLTTRRLCDEKGVCGNFQVQDPVTPTCVTQTATVRGTDLTTYFGWLMAGFGVAALAFGGGL